MEAVTLVRNARFAVAWDPSRQGHVYRSDVDVAFDDTQIIHVGPGYAGAVAHEIDGAGLMVMPGLVDIHSHPFSEPMNRREHGHRHGRLSPQHAR